MKSIRIQILTLLLPAEQNINSLDWFTYFYQKALKCDTFYSKVKGADGSWKLTAWDGLKKILQVEENELRQAKTNILWGRGRQKSHLQPKCKHHKVKEDST